jgi:hypothetical protein
LHERFWDRPSRTATDRWYVIDAETATVASHAMSTCAWERSEVHQMLEELGFVEVEFHDSLAGEVKAATPGLYAVIATR